MGRPRDWWMRIRARFPGASGSALVVGLILAAVAAGLAWWLAGNREWVAVGAGGGLSRRRALEALVRACVWWSALASAVVAGGLAVAACIPAWRGGAGWVGSGPPSALVEGREVRWKPFALLLVCILVAAAGTRGARLGLSNYNDENHSYTRLVAGIWQNFGEENQRFRRPGWMETAFGNHTGNNGFLQSILARLCHDTWRRFADPADGAIIEWPSRLPAVAGGLFSIFAVAMAFRRCGHPGLGLLAALVLAAHPWHLRYTSEARAYGLMMAGLAGSVWFLMAAIRSGRWRDWLGHAGFLLLALWAQVGALFFVLGMQGGLVLWAVGLAWRRPEMRRAIRDHALRWAVSGVAAALVAAFVLSPGLVQLAKALQEHPAMNMAPPAGWWRDVLSLLATGARWVPAGNGNPLSPATGQGVLSIPAYGAFWLLVLLGLWRLGRDNGTRLSAVLVLGGMAGLVAFYERSVIASEVLMWWYAVPMLPLMAMAVAGAFRAGPSRNRGRSWVLPSVLGAVLLAGWAPVFVLYLQHGKADPRSLTRMARGGDFPNVDRDVITAALWSDGGSYDPLMRWLDDGDWLDARIAEAARRGVPLYVLTAHEGKARQSHPEVVARLHGGEEFTLVHVAWGLEDDTFTNRLYRYNPPDP